MALLVIFANLVGIAFALLRGDPVVTWTEQELSVFVVGSNSEPGDSVTASISDGAVTCVNAHGPCPEGCLDGFEMEAGLVWIMQPEPVYNITPGVIEQLEAPDTYNHPKD